MDAPRPDGVAAAAAASRNRGADRAGRGAVESEWVAETERDLSLGARFVCAFLRFSRHLWLWYVIDGFIMLPVFSALYLADTLISAGMGIALGGYISTCGVLQMSRLFAFLFPEGIPIGNWRFFQGGEVLVALDTFGIGCLDHFMMGWMLWAYNEDLPIESILFLGSLGAANYLCALWCAAAQRWTGYFAPLKLRMSRPVAFCTVDENEGPRCTSCVICLEQFVATDMVSHLPCKHIFHPKCLKPWLRNHKECPYRCSGRDARRSRARAARQQAAAAQRARAPEEDVSWDAGTDGEASKVKESAAFMTSPRREAGRRRSPDRRENLPVEASIGSSGEHAAADRRCVVARQADSEPAPEPPEADRSGSPDRGENLPVEASTADIAEHVSADWGCGVASPTDSTPAPEPPAADRIGSPDRGENLPVEASTADIAEHVAADRRCVVAPQTDSTPAPERPVAPQAINEGRGGDGLTLVMGGDAPASGLEFLEAPHRSEQSFALRIENSAPSRDIEGSVVVDRDAQRWEQWVIDADEGEPVSPTAFVSRIDAKQERYQALAWELLKSEQSALEPARASNSSDHVAHLMLDP